MIVFVIPVSIRLGYKSAFSAHTFPDIEIKQINAKTILFFICFLLFMTPCLTVKQK